MYARCPDCAFAALTIRPQPLRYLVIMQNCIIWPPAIYIHAREYGTVTCCPCSPPYPASTLPLTGESCFSKEGVSNLPALCRSYLHEVTLAKTQMLTQARSCLYCNNCSSRCLSRSRHPGWHKLRYLLLILSRAQCAYPVFLSCLRIPFSLILGSSTCISLWECLTCTACI